MIYTLESREHSNLLFDGSQLSAWKLPQQGNSDEVALLTQEAQTKLAFGSRRSSANRLPLKQTSSTSLAGGPSVLRLIWSWHLPRDPRVLFSHSAKICTRQCGWKTWVNELVVVQGTLFEPVLTIQPDRRNFRLRIAYHENTGDENGGVLKVLDLNGNVLLKLDGVKPTLEASGIYIYNRGQDLTVRRLRVYRQPTEIKNPTNRLPLNPVSI